MYDAVILGAGPAGCAAARLLAERGLRALLLERCKLPRYKSCSGQLIAKSLRLARAYFGAEVPESVTCAPAENLGTVLYDEHGRELRFEQRGLNVWRGAFDGWLAERAAEAGAELRPGARALAVAEEGGIVAVRLKGEGEPVRARWLIDCSGAVGGPRGRGGADSAARPNGGFIATRQSFNRGSIDLDPRYFYAWLQPELSGYDAWCNVKDGQLVLGVAAPAGVDLRPYHARFLDFLRRAHGLRIEEELWIDRWALPEVRPGCAVNLGAGRALRAGEVAGFLNPMGEGVSAALESGHLAAEAILARFDDPAGALAAYGSAVEPLRAYMRRQWSLVAGMSERFARMRR